jgi:hypothetical protein
VLFWQAGRSILRDDLYLLRVYWLDPELLISDRCGLGAVYMSIQGHTALYMYMGNKQVRSLRFLLAGCAAHSCYHSMAGAGGCLAMCDWNVASNGHEAGWVRYMCIRPDRLVRMAWGRRGEDRWDLLRWYSGVGGTALKHIRGQ